MKPVNTYRQLFFLPIKSLFFLQHAKASRGSRRVLSGVTTQTTTAMLGLKPCLNVHCSGRPERCYINNQQMSHKNIQKTAKLYIYICNDMHGCQVTCISKYHIPGCIVQDSASIRDCIEVHAHYECFFFPASLDMYHHIQVNYNHSLT